jgi:uncharacterized RDD family membrane protein YckC
MNCPKCRSAEINKDGVCLVCGFRTNNGDPKQDSSRPETVGLQPAAADTASQAMAADAAEPQAEIPEWRQELSRRLLEIKQRREAGDPGMPSMEPAAAPETAVMQEPIDAEPEPARPPTPRKPRRVPRAASQDVPDATIPAATIERAVISSAAPSEPQPAKPAADVFSAADVPMRPPAAKGQFPHKADIKTMIDTVMIRQALEERPAVPGPEFPSPSPVTEEPGEDKLILLTRTLAGLVDIVIVIVCGCSIIFAVDIVERIEVFDTVSLAYYFLLLLAMYFVYSLFFLGMAGQTIGMMLTDLRLVSDTFQRPKGTQILLRSATFLLSLAGLGVGLFWGFFDRNSRCLHDRISRTRVTRVSVF